MKSCFVIGPIGSPGSETRTAADHFMKYIAAPCLEELGYGPPQRADLLPEPGRITSQIIELLMTSDLVIADLTGSNANVYYELSLRHALAKPAIHMAFDPTPLPFDVYDNRTIFYTMHADRVEKAKNELTQQIRTINKKGYKSRNPIVEAIGLVELDKSAEPVQQSLAIITRGMDHLRSEVSYLRYQLSLPQIHNPLLHPSYTSYSGLLGTNPPPPNALANTPLPLNTLNAINELLKGNALTEVPENPQDAERKR